MKKKQRKPTKAKSQHHDVMGTLDVTGRVLDM